LFWKTTMSYVSAGTSVGNFPGFVGHSGQ